MKNNKMMENVMKKIVLVLLITCLVFMENVSGKLRKRPKRAWASFGPKPSNSSCLFLCPPSWCYNGGTCSVSDFDCTFQCTCVNGFTDSRCNTSLIDDVTTESSTTASENEVTTLRPLSERTCLPGFVCQNGYCDKENGIKCTCDDGWSGLFCDFKVTCPLDCDDGSVCKLIMNTYACVRTMPSDNETSTVATTAESSTLRSLDVRTCFPGFVCEHGYCAQQGVLKCTCDAGWTGAFCEQADCLPTCNDDSECNVVSGVPTCVLKQSILTPVSNTTDTTILVATTTPSISNTTLRDLQERTCVPGFVCKHGYCKAPFVPKCVCDAGWTGAFCELPGCSPECNDESECKVITGVPICVVKHTTQAPALTLRPLSERTCVAGFVCQHGYCPAGEFRCICDSGWKGAFCEALICFPECSNDTECKLVSGNPVCVTKATPPGSSSTMAITTTTEEPDDEECPGFNHTLRPYKVRECVPGYVCKYGYCVKESYSDGMNSGINIECICDDGAYGPMCEYKCCLNCSEHGKCSILNNTQVCLCEHRDDYKYTGKLCETKVILRDSKQHKEATWYLWVVGVCAFVLVILILVLVVMPYWLWRNRVTLVMKIVHFFQPYEDDDDRLWDAFISYKSAETDEQFVLKQLYPKLEKELGFKLCMHQRDFVPGETIANNIINAVNNSRRTILVLTPRYVESEFTRFEYQMAQQEMLKKKHRIIPVLLEDITYLKDSMDPNLKQIIGSVTYLEYPKDSNEKKIQKFWKRLELSLPKKRSLSESSTDSVYLSSYHSDKINISVINSSDSLTLEPIKENSKSNSENSLDVVIDNEKNNIKENDSSENVLDVLKLPLERNNPAFVEDIQLEMVKGESKNDKNQHNDVKLNIEKYISMVEGTSC